MADEQAMLIFATNNERKRDQTSHNTVLKSLGHGWIRDRVKLSLTEFSFVETFLSTPLLITG
jgi:hypothetical protein